MNVYCKTLQSDDKSKRRKALDDIKCTIIKGKYEDIEESEQLFRQVVDMFSDTSEACRECSVKLIKELLNIAAERDCYAAMLIPAINKRLGEEEIIEHSEEVRLELVSLLHVFITKFTRVLPVYMTQIITILGKTLYDPYPAIRRESSECTTLLARSAPKHFSMESKTLIKPLIDNFSHQHYRIRLAAIPALGDVVMHGDGTSMETVIGPLGECLSDQVIMVRKAVVEVIGMWLLHHKDRYSYFHYLISLILTSICDDAPEIQEIAIKYWHQAGELYLKENEDDLKDKIDFLTEVPGHYPKNVQRPNLGCRVMVQRHMMKILLCVEMELEDWRVETRVKAATLFRITLLNAESTMTHHVQKILSILVRGCKDEDSRVVEHLVKGAEYVGYFVSPDIYLKFILPELESSATTAHLRVLTAILKGCRCESLSEKLVEIMDVLKQHHIIWNRDFQYQSHLLNCCSVIMDICNDKSAVVSQEMFNILIAVLSLAADDYISRKSKALLSQLQEINKFDMPECMFSTYCEALLNDISPSVEVWSVDSPERYILETVFENSGQNLNLNMHIILPLLINITKPGKDPQLKLKILTMLSSFIVQYGLSEYDSEDFILSLIQDVILPNLMWKAGCSAEAIRTASVTCLYTLLRKPPILSESAVKIIVDISLPLLLSAVEDSSKSTRSLACCTLSNLVCLLRNFKLLTSDSIHYILAVIVKRLDDVCDEVRVECLNVIRSLFLELPTDYNEECSKPILESMFNSMFLHLDDPDQNFQSTLTDTIKDVCHVNPSLAWNKLNEIRGSYRSTVDCDQLLEYFKNLNISTSK